MNVIVVSLDIHLKQNIDRYPCRYGKYLQISVNNLLFVIVPPY